MKLETARKVVCACAAAGVLCAILYGMTERLVFVILTMVIIAAEFPVFFLYIRCPHCGRFLGRAGMNSSAEYCPFCGKNIKE